MHEKNDEAELQRLTDEAREEAEALRDMLEVSTGGVAVHTTLDASKRPDLPRWMRRWPVSGIGWLGPSLFGLPVPRAKVDGSGRVSMPAPDLNLTRRPQSARALRRLVASYERSLAAAASDAGAHS